MLGPTCHKRLKLHPAWGVTFFTFGPQRFCEPTCEALFTALMYSGRSWRQLPLTGQKGRGGTTDPVKHQNRLVIGSRNSLNQSPAAQRTACCVAHCSIAWGIIFFHSNALVESTIQRALRTPLLGERPLGRARQLLLPSIAAVDYCDLRKKAKYQLHWISCTSESETSAACASSSIQ